MVGIIYTISYVCRASETDFQTTPPHRLTIFCTLFELFGCTGAAAWAVFAAGIQQSPPRHSHIPRAPPVEFRRAPPVVQGHTFTPLWTVSLLLSFGAHWYELTSSGADELQPVEELTSCGHLIMLNSFFFKCLRNSQMFIYLKNSVTAVGVL